MWQVMRVNYRGDTGDTLLRDVITPAISEHVGEHASWYFRRDWRGGDHLRVYLYTDGGSDIGLTRAGQEIATGAAALIDQAGALDRVAYTERQRRKVLPDLELRSYDDAISESGFHLDAAVPTPYGGPEGLSLARVMLAYMTGTTIERLGEIGGRRLTALQCMAAHARYLRDTEGLDASYLTFRSHAEGFLNHADPGGQVRRSMDHAYDANRSAVTSAAAWYWEGGALAARCTVSDRWVANLQDHYEAVLDAIRKRRICLTGDLVEVAEAVGLTRVYNRTRTASPSEFHRRANCDPVIQRYAQTPEHTARRFLTNLLYFVLQGLGISPLDRYTLCYILARGCDADAPWSVDKSPVRES